MNNPIQTFIHGTLSPDLPPANPILRPGWGGLAFDRNRYQELAPSNVWNALLEMHCSLTPGNCEIFSITYVQLASGAQPESIPATLPDLDKFWKEDVRFLKDHYIFSPTHNWLVRLDQDVTLFVGERVFLGRVIDKLGGLDVVMEKMVDDMDPGPTDSVGLQRYLDSITHPLR